MKTPRLKFLVFRFAAIFIVPLLFMVFLEGVLRLGGYGYDPRYLKESREDGRIILRDNPEFSKPFFPPDIAARQRPLPTLFAADKPAGTIRIFILGESAAAGYPARAFGFPRILEVLLRDQFPGVRFEVINTGLAAINSHVILQIARDLAPRHPDFFIIYMGNNEVIGPYGPGTVFSPFISDLRVVRAAHFVKTTRTGQLLDSLMTRRGVPDAARQEAGKEIFLDRQLHADDPRLAKVYDHFQQNLEDILTITRRSGARTIVSTVAGNLLDVPPLASAHDPALSQPELEEWRKLFTAGISHEAGGNYAAALEQYDAARRIDGDFAELHYRLGRCQLALADPSAARESFIKARELDTLRFRPDTRINLIIRQTASGREPQSLSFLDAEKIFEAESPYGLTSDKYFLDHVHLNFAGNYLLAKEVFGAMRDHLPRRVLDQRDDKPLLSEKECAAILAFTGYNEHEVLELLIYSLMYQAPYMNRTAFADMIQNKRRQEEGLRYYRTPQGLAEAAEAHRIALSRNPDRDIHVSFSRILLQLNRPMDALKHLREADKLLPHPDTKNLIRHLEGALSANPSLLFPPVEGIIPPL